MSMETVRGMELFTREGGLANSSCAGIGMMVGAVIGGAGAGAKAAARNPVWLKEAAMSGSARGAEVGYEYASTMCAGLRALWHLATG